MNAKTIAKHVRASRAATRRSRAMNRVLIGPSARRQELLEIANRI
jgi:hypothetical protein